MEKIKVFVPDMSFSTFRDIYNDTQSYYAGQSLEIHKEFISMDLFGTAQKNLTMGWKLLSPFIESVSKGEADAFTLRWKYYLSLRKKFERFEEDFGLNQMLTKTEDTSVHYVNILGGDVLTYAFYLAAADGQLAIEETAYIETVVKMGLNQGFTLELIKNSPVVDEEDRKKYENTAMTSLSIAMIADRYYKAKPDSGVYANYTGMLIEFLEKFGKGLVGIDGEISPEEKESIDALLKNFKTVSESFANQVK